MKVSITCNYCGYTWMEVIYDKASLENKRCQDNNCRDSNLTIKDLKGKVDQYEGCPPFPIKKIFMWPDGSD